jgi:hypothetical protein
MPMQRLTSGECAAAAGDRAGASGTGWSALAFGSKASHLDSDLRSGGRAQQVTLLLEACLSARSGDPRQWTLPGRLQGLLAIALAGDNAALTLLARCANPVCAEPMELDVDLGRFVADPPDECFDWSPDGRTALSLRLPNPVDQERWRTQGLAGDVDTLRVMASSLVIVIDGKAPAPGFLVPEVWMDGLADAFESRDPLTVLELEADCPECGGRSRIPLDLERCLLDRFREQQRRLLEDVHCLASAYHWTEAAILELPRWRRALYVARVRQETGR